MKKLTLFLLSACLFGIIAVSGCGSSSSASISNPSENSFSSGSSVAQIDKSSIAGTYVRIETDSKHTIVLKADGNYVDDQVASNSKDANYNTHYQGNYTIENRGAHAGDIELTDNPCAGWCPTYYIQDNNLVNAHDDQDILVKQS